MSLHLKKPNVIWKFIGLAFSLGFTIVASITVGLFIGGYLDRKLFTGYSFRVLFMFLGAFTGLRSIYRQYKR